MGSQNSALEPFYRGAEADLFLSHTGPWQTIIKKRAIKDYRNPLLDYRLRRERTLSEASTIHDARVAGVRVPSVLDVDLEKNTIVMMRIGGSGVRECLDSMKSGEARRLFRLLGEQIGRLHSAGITHGDLTTSNIIITAQGTPFLVDFGMSRRTTEPEDRGVDLHLLERSINATHQRSPSLLIKSFVEGYAESAGEKMASLTLAKAREISRRGRYFAIR
ncbi:MAG TPA: Kae1-associated kinase Bud32 [Candidatus Bathyarchaeia archaeon]|nr:Kae1-associated kinase Bud32 [Candidatus Bathyarchaeia archaeon]